MFLGSSLIVLACATGWLWWRLTRLQQRNAELSAELLRLRGKLRAFR